MKEMKISKGALLTMSSILTVASFGLMFLSAESLGGETPVQLYFDPNNAIQHFRGAKIISTADDDSSATIMKRGGLVGIDTEYNFLLSGENITDNGIDVGVRRSSILGGKDNKIAHGSNETILGGEGNIIEDGNSNNSILGGNGNILKAIDNSSILGGGSNTVSGSSSEIIGGEGNEVKKSYAMAVGNNNIVDGYNSVAMGSGSKVSGKNSFLWTDGQSSKVLSKNNVFVVDGQSGMVVNSTKAHSFAQLTVSGSLILYNDDSEGLKCNFQRKGVLKVVDNDDKKCLCSCDGSGRNAIHDGVMCPFKCSGNEPENAVCGTANRVCDTNPYTYTGSCKTGMVVQGTGAFFVSTKVEGGKFVNYINWSCQSDTGLIIPCSGALYGTGCPNKHTESNGCTGPAPEHAVLVEGSDEGFEGEKKRTLYPDGQEDGKNCAYICDGENEYYYNGGECQLCPEGNPYNKETKKCAGMNNCPNPYQRVDRDDINKQWVCPQTIYGKCLYTKNGGNGIYGGDLTLLGRQKIVDYKDLIPRTDESKYLKCIDGDQFTGNYEKNTCSYECTSGSFCYKQKDAPDKCINPTCSYANQLHTEGKYRKGGFAGHYANRGIYTPEEIAKYYEIGKIYNNGYYVDSNGNYNYNTSLTESDISYIKDKLKTKVNINNTGEVVNYLRNLNETTFDELFKDFGKCMFRCDTKNRFTGVVFIENTKYTFSDTSYRCVDEKQREYLENHSEKKTCQSVTFFGFTGGILYEKNGPQTENQSWKYVERNDFSTSSTPCKWTCPEGYEALSGWAPRYNTAIYSNGIFRTDLFVNGSTYYTCYQKCTTGTYLSNTNIGKVNGFTRGLLECKTCSGNWELTLDNSLIQRGNVPNTSNEYRGCTCKGELEWKDGKCKCTGTNRESNSEGKCVCKGQTTGSNCECPGSSKIDSNYNCTCINEGERFNPDKGDCVCDESRGFYDYNGNCVIKSTSCEYPSTWITCESKNKTEEGCFLIPSDYIYNYEICEQEIKKYNLNLQILNQGEHDKFYKSGDKIEYKVIISDTGNFELTGFTVAVYVGIENKNDNNLSKSWIEQKISSGVQNQNIYTGFYILKSSDLKKLEGETGDFKVFVQTLKGKSQYFHLGNGNNLTDGFTVTIKK